MFHHPLEQWTSLFLFCPSSFSFFLQNLLYYPLQSTLNRFSDLASDIIVQLHNLFILQTRYPLPGHLFLFTSPFCTPVDDTHNCLCEQMPHPTTHLQLVTGFDIFFITDPRHRKATYIEHSVSSEAPWSPPLEHLNCCRHGNKCELFPPACQLDDRRRHLHFCRLHLHPV